MGGCLATLQHRWIQVNTLNDKRMALGAEMECDLDFQVAIAGTDADKPEIARRVTLALFLKAFAK
jgi:hypothetical protein